MELLSAVQMVDLCKERGLSMPELVLTYEATRASVHVDQVRQEMRDTLDVMRESVRAGIAEDGEFAHIVKGYGKRFEAARKLGRLLGGKLVENVILYSLAVSQYNASLGRIVACPTAGSSGVVPGALLPIAEELKASDEQIIDALLVMAGIGTITAVQGPISGAEGGCQAECGVAAAMAAGAIVYLADGEQYVFDAASLALQSSLGLVCDPLASLVEVPCVTRNATSAMTAIVSANMALAGIPGIIPYDETVLAMKAVGRSMPESLRETSLGGLAATPTGKRLYRLLQQENQELPEDS